MTSTITLHFTDVRMLEADPSVCFASFISPSMQERHEEVTICFLLTNVTAEMKWIMDYVAVKLGSAHVI